MIESALKLVREVVLGLAAVLVINTTVFANYYIPSESMVPTLEVGDRVLVSKFPYGFSRYSIFGSPDIFSGRLFERPIARGDVVVFKHPRDNATDLIKRILGLPGDVIEMRGGRLIINGAPVETELRGGGHDARGMSVIETLANGPRYTTLDQGHGPGDEAGPFVVPPGSYFALGDNRDNSSDSRWPKAIGVGFIPAENIVGRAEAVLWSWSGEARPTEPRTWLHAFRLARTMTFLR